MTSVLFATYPMAFHTPGGGEMQLMAYRRHLPAAGVDVTLFDMWNPHFLKHDLLHFFSCVGGSWHLCHFAKQIGMPLVISASLWITPETRNLYPCDEIRMQMVLADRIVTNSDTESDMLADVLALPRHKFATVYNGVEDIFFEKADSVPFRAYSGIEGPFILNVGNIEPRKNQLNLVKAMKALPGYKLALMGHIRDAAYGEEVLRQGGDQLYYFGPVEHMNPLLRSAYAASAVFVLPSTLETPGLAALEAWAQGIPVVVTAEGSTHAYFGDEALYVDHTDIDDIARVINQALRTSKTDDGRRNARCRRFAWPSVVERLSEIYREVLSETRASRI